MTMFDAEAGDAGPISRRFSVSELLRYLQGALAQVASEVEVTGEIHAVTESAAGHCYLELKDTHEDALVKVNVFRGVKRYLQFQPKVGDLIVVQGSIGIYAPRGQMSLTASSVRLAGDGHLFAQFLALKEKLQREGLFEQSRKKPVSPYPTTIGIVTSLEAAALQDVLRTLAEHAPHLNVIVYPTLVQGAEAPESIVRALAIAETRREVDCLLLVRGGGSISDLWCFNDERVARAIAGLTLPVVTGIGHETDTSIADLVADVRSLTPTAAALFVATPSEQTRKSLRVLGERMSRAFRAGATRSQEVNSCIKRLRLSMQWCVGNGLKRLDTAVFDLGKAPANGLLAREARLSTLEGRLKHSAVDAERQFGRLSELRYRMQTTASMCGFREAGRLNALDNRLRSSMEGFQQAQQLRLGNLKVRLDARDISKLMESGFALVMDAQGKPVNSISCLHKADELALRLRDGQAHVTVESVKPLA